MSFPYTTLSRLLDEARLLLEVSLRRNSWDWRKALGIVSLHVTPRTCGFFDSSVVDVAFVFDESAEASAEDDPMPKPL